MQQASTNHKLAAGALAVLFLVTVQLTSAVFRFLLPAVAVYAAVLTAYSYHYLKVHGVYTFWLLVRVPLFVAAMLSIYLLLPIATPLRSAYLIVAAGLLYMAEVWLPKVSEQVNFFGTLLTFFGLSLGLFAVNFYMPDNTFVVLLVLGLVTYAVCRTSFEHVLQPDRVKNTYAALIVLCVVEAAWALVLLPLHFTVLAVVVLNVFYVLWILAYYHLFHNLTGKKVSFHVGFALAIVCAALASTPWH
jgi:hypothetical protein